MEREQHVTVFNRVNSRVPEHLLQEDEVAMATNVDFASGAGGARVRRGSWKRYTAGTGTVTELYRHYGRSLGADSRVFAISSKDLYQGYTGTFALVRSGATNDVAGITSYGERVYIGLTPAGSAVAVDTDGNAIAWPPGAPSTAPVVSSSTLPPLTVISTMSVAEGTLGTATVGTDTTTGVADTDTLRLEFRGVPTNTDLSTNAGHTIGDYGIHGVSLKISDPARVVRVSQDYSIGDDTFTNFWHTEMDVLLEYKSLASPEKLVDALLQSSEGTAVSADEREAMISIARGARRVPVSHVAAAKDSWTVWKTMRPDFKLIGQGGSWSNIGAVRLVVEARDTVTVEVANWNIAGAEDFPLNDAAVGYAYWETWAQVDDNGNITDESAPSPVSGRVQMQYAQATATFNEAIVTPYNRRILYAQGGYMQQPYAVATITDTGLVPPVTATHNITDVTAISRGRTLNSGVMPSLYNSVSVASKPFLDRIFIGHENELSWTFPGRPNTIPYESNVTVSHKGDPIRAIIPWASTLVIVNRDTIYEMHGSVFEGRNQDWVLQKTAARRGSLAFNSAIETPYGIPLVGYDGIYFYVPGQGIEQSIGWVTEALKDAWEGSDTVDPGALKGGRIPVVYKPYIFNAVATFGDERLYVAVPTGTDQYPKTVFVLDFKTQRVWWYTYPFSIYSMFWDAINAEVIVGSDNGCIFKLNGSFQDEDAAGTINPVGWLVKTRKWTTPSDLVLENVQVEYEGTGIIAKGIVDGTSTTTLGTLTSSERTWETLPFHGTVGNSLEFELSGSRNFAGDCCVYGVSWDALVEPARVKYYKTDYDNNGYDGEKRWVVDLSKLEIFGTTTVTKVTFVDGTAVMTNTLVGPSNGQRVYANSFPAEQYGDIAYSTYTSPTPFKVWNTHFVAENEPVPVNAWKSKVQSLEENIVDAFDCDINPNGTTLGTCYVDNTAISTGTFTGSQRQSYTHKLPVETYGRTVYVQYSGSGFKHYNTWFHLRPQPDRWTNYVSDKQSGNEQRFETHECILDPLGNIVYGTVFVDSTAVGTYTYGGSGQTSFVNALPHETYGRTTYTIYNVSPGGYFKHYKTWVEGQPEPDRVLKHQEIITFPTRSNLKTWLAELNPLGQTVTGVAYLDGTAISTATFGGGVRKVFHVALDLDATYQVQAGHTLDIRYDSSYVFKHYDTKVETEEKPFGKKQWAMTYKKIGGATNLDLLRYWHLDAEAEGTATITSVWDVDGTSTNTQTLELVGRQQLSYMSFPPGVRSRICQVRLWSSQDFEVYKSSLDIMRVGVKGFSRMSIPGTPVERSVLNG